MMTAEVSLHWADILVFVAVLAISIAIGVYFALSGKGQRTTQEFLMGSKKLKLLPVTLSLYMTYVSANFVLGSSTEMYLFGTQQLMQGLGFIVGYIIAAIMVVPVIYPLQLVSQFQYHEMRFRSRPLRLLLSMISIIRLTFQTGVTLYAPAIALEAVTGLKVWISVLCTGVVATIYTSIGGIKAVVWTDAFQAIIFFAGILVVVIMGVIKVGGLDEVWNIAEEGKRIEFFNLNIDYRARATLWNVCVDQMFLTFGLYGTGQSSIQRYISLPTMRAARLSLLLNIPMVILAYASIGIIGLTVYAYYTLQGCDPLRARYIRSPNQILPYFIVDVLSYPGFSGMFISVLFSGALSTLSSNMSSVSALMWKDFLEPLAKNLKEIHKAMVTKAVVVVFGMISVGMALLVQILPGHITQITAATVGSTVGGTAGPSILGLFVPQGNWKGAVAGIIASLSLTMWMNVGQLMAKPYRVTLPTVMDNCTLAIKAMQTPSPSSLENIFPLYAVSFNWFGFISTGVAVFVGIVVSFMTGPQDPKTVGKHLIIPVCDSLCCCLPLKLRKFFWCGVPRDREEDLEQEQETQAETDGSYEFDKAIHGSLNMGTNEETDGSYEFDKVIHGSLNMGTNETELDSTPFEDTVKPDNPTMDSFAQPSCSSDPSYDNMHSVV